jgi:hypothetical membrane protein
MPARVLKRDFSTPSQDNAEGDSMRYNVLAVAFIIVVIAVAHWLAPAAYSWRDNTISELAAQGYERAWIMRVGFMGFGALIVLGAADRARRMRGSRLHLWREVPLVVYGLGILVAGIFSTAPFLPGVAYSAGEASVHSAVATLAGVGLSLAMLLHAATPGSTRQRILHLVALVLTTAISALFGMATAGAGIWQRCLYLVGFAWLVYSERN